MENWYALLCEELKNYEIRENINMLEYYKFSSICYAITEYIFKDLNINTKEKSQELNKNYDVDLKYVYNPRYIYNDLKHMNPYKSNKWELYHRLDFKQLAYELELETSQLVKMYSVRNVLSNICTIYEEIIDLDIFDSLNSSLLAKTINPIIQQAELISSAIQPMIQQTEMISSVIQPMIQQTEMISSAIQPMIQQTEIISSAIQPVIQQTEMISSAIQPVIQQTEMISRAMEKLQKHLPLIDCDELEEEDINELVD